MYYTIGQRRGLDLGGKQGEDGRWFVVKKDLEHNVLYVSHGDESPLYSSSCTVSNLNWIGYTPERSFECSAKFRYRQGEQKVKVTLSESGATVEFAENSAPLPKGSTPYFTTKKPASEAESLTK